MFEDVFSDEGVADFVVYLARSDKELVVVAHDLVPGDRLVESCRLVSTLIIDCVRPRGASLNWG